MGRVIGEKVSHPEKVADLGVSIAKDGAGRLYYRAAMTYAPASLQLQPADRGFAVARRYEPVDDPHDVNARR